MTDRNADRCQGMTKKGERCKNPADSCRYHAGQKSKSAAKTPKAKAAPKVSMPKLVPSKALVPSSPKHKPRDVTPKKQGHIVLEKHYRGISESKCYDALGFSCQDAMKYSRRYEEHAKRDPEWAKRMKPYPKEFQIVLEHLMAVCENDLGGNCGIHPVTPAVQWDNTKETFSNALNQWKEDLRREGNHYSHSSEIDQNPLKAYGVQDRPYCMCNEVKPMDARNAFETISFSLDGNDEDWTSYHGAFASFEEKIDYPANLIVGKTTFETQRKVTPELRSKIMKDSFDFLGQEYKIHLMPKPEYQIPVLRELIKLLKNDPEFKAHIVSWKATIIYSQVVGELNLPAIVIYPVWGQRSTKLCIKKIIEHFSQFNADEIGMGKTPRFNYRYNNLVYWANGAGDQKKLLPDKYFTTKDKIFYKGHEILFEE